VSVVDCAVVIENEGRILLVRRPEHGLWGGLWEVPRSTVEKGEAWETCAVRAASQHAGLIVRLGNMFGTHSHTVMNRKIKLIGYCAVAENVRDTLASNAVLIAASEIEKFPLASPQKALLALWADSR
jgi:ADP-ribose pyrophosphatase YjhB (NUDIX family)